MSFGKFMQPEERHGAILHDPWDRPYDAILDKRSMDPVGPITPMFTAPFYPPIETLTTVNPATNRQELGRVFVRMDEWRRQLREAAQHYDASIRGIAQQSFTEMASDIIANPEKYPRVLAIAGRPPLPEAFLDALEVALPWALGQEELTDAELDAKGWFTPSELAAFRAQRQARPDEQVRRAAARERFGLDHDDSTPTPKPRRGRPRVAA